MYTFNDVFRGTLDDDILMANNGLSATVQRNWNYSACINGVFKTFFQTLQDAVDAYNEISHENIIISDINAAVSVGYDIWLNKSTSFYACLNNVKDSSTVQVMSNAKDCFFRVNFNRSLYD